MPAVAHSQSAEQRIQQLDSEVSAAFQAKDYARAAEKARVLLEAIVALRGSDAPEVAIATKNLAFIHDTAESWEAAAKAYEQLVAWLDSRRAPAAERVDAWLSLARVHGRRLAPTASNDAAAQAVSIAETIDGPRSAAVADALYTAGEIAERFANYARAEGLYARAVSIWESDVNAGEDLATGLIALGHLYERMGVAPKAEPLYLRARTLLEKGGDSVSLAAVFNNLGSVYLAQGRYGEAEAMYRRTLAIHENTGEDQAGLAIVLDNLAEVLRVRGNFEAARPLYRRALEIGIAVWGPDHPDVAVILNNQALLAKSTGDVAEAIRLYRRVLTIRVNAYGERHPVIAQTLSNLGVLLRQGGWHEEAETVHGRAVALLESSVRADHPALIQAFMNHGVALNAKGKYAEARRAYERALERQHGAYGDNHSITTVILTNMAILAWETGRVSDALAFERRAMDGDEHLIGLHTASGSERTRKAFLATLAGRLDFCVALHIQGAPRDGAATALALETILRRKGRILDVLSGEAGWLRSRVEPAFRQQAQALMDVRAELAALVLQSGALPPDHRQTIADAQAKADRLEEALSQSSATFRAVAAPVSIAAVQKAIPTDSVLLEFVFYNPYDRRTGEWLAPHYAVYTLTPRGPSVWADLGNAVTIDTALRELRRALTDPARPDPKPLAMKLWTLVLKPVSGALAGVEHILVSPDGQLNLVPFAALVDQDGRYLATRHQFTYLTSGRDLLRLAATRPEPMGPHVIIANPDYDAELAAARPKGDAPPAAEAAPPRRFEPLRETASEAAGVADLLGLPAGSVVERGQATERFVKQLHGPRILHMATHAYFIDAESDQRSRIGERALLPVATDLDQGAVDSYPLLRSGLALAGANRGGNTSDDGILTALEATGLDLWSTDLVVLSACETGIGAVENGEGIHGLRRAFVLAGARTVINSLWKVADQATKDLMVDYYRLLTKGLGKSEALAMVQRQRLEAPDVTSHPYYWASFIVSGDPAPMRSGIRVP
jgi:CHAT domain-containing protein/Tfp pilus assembly protein PilF